MAEKQEMSQPRDYPMIVEKDVKIPMRDGTLIFDDVFRPAHLSMVPGTFAEHHHEGGHEREQLHHTRIEHRDQLLGQGHQCRKQCGREFQYCRCLGQSTRRDQQPSGFGRNQ